MNETIDHTTKCNIWWYFRENKTKVVVQTDHPKYKDTDYILEFDTNTQAEFDYFETWFHNFKNDIQAGRLSLHEFVKQVPEGRPIP